MIIDMHIGTGQSLRLPRNVSVDDPMRLSVPAGGGSSMMFNAGIMPDGAPVTSFVPLAEDPAKQSSGAPFLNYLQRELFSRIGRYQPMLYAIAAEGGTTYAQRARGTKVWQEILRLVARAAAIAAAQNDLIVVRSLVVADGEADYSAGLSRVEFRDGRLQLARRANGDIRRITGQTEDVLVIPYQTAREPASDPSGTVPAPRTEQRTALAVLDAEDRDARIVSSGSTYAFRLQDTTHVGAMGVCQMAEREADMVLHHVYGTGRRRCARSIRAEMVAPAVARITYLRPMAFAGSDPYMNIAGLGPGLGFDAAHAFGGAALPLTAALTAGDPTSVDITFGTAPTAPVWLFNAGLCPAPNLEALVSQAYSALREADPFVTAANSATGADQHHWSAVEMWRLHPYAGA